MNILSELQPQRAYTIEALPGVQECKLMTANNSGVVYTNDYSVTHRRNNKTSITYILETEADKLAETRAAVANLTSLDLDTLGYTYPKMGRQISCWLGLHAKNVTVPRSFLPFWHFQYCDPCELDYAYMHDMTAAYWSIACSAPSLLCRIDTASERVIWLGVPPSVETKWNECKTRLEPYKRLRLAIIGVSATGFMDCNENRAYCYANGEVVKMPGSAPTYFQSLAILSVRIAFELTQLQMLECQAWYANADCVVTECEKCKLWQDMGIRYRTKAAGAADVRAIGTYKIGDYETEPYRVAKLRAIPVYHAREPELLERPVYHASVYK